MTEKLYAEQYGKGKVLTLLHGYPFDHTIWLELVPELGQEARLILPDLRGHGKSPAPAGKYSMKAMAEDVLRLLDSLNIEKTVVAGHSMGGYIALAMARDYPQRVDGLVLVASHAYADPPEKREARLKSIQVVKKEGKVTGVVSSMPEKLTYNDKVEVKCRELIGKANPNGVMGALAGMAERPDSMDFLKSTDIPLMIIAGQDDQIIPIQTSREMAGQMKKPWLVEIAGAGHMLMLDQPKKTAHALEVFITSL